MNKKLLAAFIVAVLSLPACAQDTGTFMPKHWQEAIVQKVDYATFEHAMKTLSKPFLLTIPVTKQFFERDGYESCIPFEHTAIYRQLKNVKTYPSKVGCKAYALDEHWILAGATCLWNGRHTITFTDKSGTYATGLVQPDVNRKDLKIDGEKIPWEQNLFVQPHETQLPHVILVRVPAATAKGLNLQRAAKINVLAFDKDLPSHLNGGDFYINSARLGANSNRKHSLSSCKDGNVVIDDPFFDFSGLSTDPLAYVKKGNLQWIGVNKGVTKVLYNNLLGHWDGQASDEYFYFNKQDAQFIKDTISKHDPAAWQRMVARHAVEVR